MPELDHVIQKVKKREELTPEEEFVYLVHIEQFSEQDAIKMIRIKPDSYENK